MSRTDIGWARSRGDRAEKEGLRRGAWYRVVEESAQPWVVLEVHQVELRVPKENLEIRKERPKGWSVVHEPHLVCPGCHKRQHVSGEPKDVKCHECGNTYAVDWKDRA
ncbi:MAG TPA: hypothetical protein VFD68_06040 [Gemmatimonadales bacterium]|nr:hypothetical protein [Gemmatimonadales bacterium]